jgi:hypothetical protein
MNGMTALYLAMHFDEIARASGSVRPAGEPGDGGRSLRSGVAAVLSDARSRFSARARGRAASTTATPC